MDKEKKFATPPENGEVRKTNPGPKDHNLSVEVWTKLNIDDPGARDFLTKVEAVLDKEDTLKEAAKILKDETENPKFSVSEKIEELKKLRKGEEGADAAKGILVAEAGKEFKYVDNALTAILADPEKLDKLERFLKKNFGWRRPEKVHDPENYFKMILADFQSYLNQLRKGKDAITKELGGEVDEATNIRSGLHSLKSLLLAIIGENENRDYKVNIGQLADFFVAIYQEKVRGHSSEEKSG